MFILHDKVWCTLNRSNTYDKSKYFKLGNKKIINVMPKAGTKIYEINELS